MAGTFGIGVLQMTDCGYCRGTQSRWQSRCEDEAWCIGAHSIDQSATSCDVPTHAAERFGEGAFQHVDPVHDAVALCSAGSTSAIQAHGMYFVGICHCPVVF